MWRNLFYYYRQITKSIFIPLIYIIMLIIQTLKYCSAIYLTSNPVSINLPMSNHLLLTTFIQFFQIDHWIPVTISTLL